MFFMAQQRAGETRSKILDAAGELFAQSGYDATSVAGICERAHVTKGAFYHHFKSKQTVFLELRDRWLAPLEAQFTLSRDPAESLPQLLQRIADMASIVFAGAREDQRRQVFLELLSTARHDPTILPAMLAPMQRYREMFAQLIQAGIAEGTFREVDSNLVAQILVSLGFGLLVQGLLDPAGGDWGALAARALPVLVQGLEEK
jgi:AcrR family transcriptional regulator